jgi:hypothetical protein
MNPLSESIGPLSIDEVIGLMLWEETFPPLEHLDRFLALGTL